MIATVYYPQLNGKLAKHDDLWITGVALVGTLVGQVSILRISCHRHICTQHSSLKGPPNSSLPPFPAPSLCKARQFLKLGGCQ